MVYFGSGMLACAVLWAAYEVLAPRLAWMRVATGVFLMTVYVAVVSYALLVTEDDRPISAGLAGFFLVFLAWILSGRFHSRAAELRSGTG